MKKAQIQFMEMIFVLVIVVIILVIGVFLYFSFSSKSVEEAGEELSDIDVTIAMNSLIGVPEITCGANCIDTLKLLVFSNVRDADINKEYYGDVFRNLNVSVSVLWPPRGSFRGVECDLAAFNAAPAAVTGEIYPENCGFYVIYPGKPDTNQHSKEILENAVSLYYPLTRKHAFGILRIEVFK